MNYTNLSDEELYFLYISYKYKNEKFVTAICFLLVIELTAILVGLLILIYFCANVWYIKSAVITLILLCGFVTFLLTKAYIKVSEKILLLKSYRRKINELKKIIS